jgi:hypothetical protein
MTKNEMQTAAEQRAREIPASESDFPRLMVEWKWAVRIAICTLGSFFTTFSGPGV